MFYHEKFREKNYEMRNTNEFKTKFRLFFYKYNVRYNNCKYKIRSIISIKKRKSKIHHRKIQKIYRIYYNEQKSFNHKKNYQQNHRKINENH